MTPAELERASTWLPEIVETLIEGVTWRQEGDEQRVVGQGGLSLNIRKGCWFQHSTSQGGWGAITLIGHLRGCEIAAAAEWLTPFLGSHPGSGSGVPGDDDDHAIESAAITTELISRLVDPTGTPAEVYLRSRGIAGALPSFVRYLPNARCGEGAIAALLTARGRVVGVQLGYIDPDGRKSTVAPTRRRFALEKAPDAVFEIPNPNGATDLLADTLITEGLEDTLSLAELGRAVRIVGIPGIGTMRHLTVKKGERVLVVRDGDDPGSPADTGLIAGVDHLMLEGARVAITCTPPGEDANSLLVGSGPKALAELLGDTVPGELSRDGMITELSRLDPLEYDAVRKQAAERLGIRVSTLDHEVARVRSRSVEPKADDAGDDPDKIHLLDEPVDLAQTLDAILFELKRYIVAADTALATVGLWCAHTHLCHHDHIRLQRSPRLAIQARTPGAGKTTLLEATAALVPRPRISSSLTASTVLRVVDAIKPTLLIDEADGVLRDPSSDLLSILNAGDRRATAWVERSVPTADGGWTVQRYSVWGPVAFAGIDELPPTQQDRSIVIQMQKALGGEIPEHLEDGTSPELVYLQRALATWVHDLDALPRPTLPELLQRQAGRVGDNWRPLIAIADLAGGRWPDLARQAAMEAVAGEARLTRVQRLLISIRNIFDERAALKKLSADDRLRIPTSS